MILIKEKLILKNNLAYIIENRRYICNIFQNIISVLMCVVFKYKRLSHEKFAIINKKHWSTLFKLHFFIENQTEEMIELPTIEFQIRKQ